jgi:hypothetical protein
MSTQAGNATSKSSKDYNIDPSLDGYIKTIIDQKLATYAFNSGIGGQERAEIKPIFKQLPNETALVGKTNTFIVLGGDRPAGALSGKGGKGRTGSGCIDLVAGLSGERPISILNTEVQETSKSFVNDAARVYITQKGNIDEYMKIPKINFVINGNTKISTESSINKSAIAIISDCTRILGRNSVKIVTHHAGKDSTQNDVEQNGVDIIAGVDLLPLASGMPKYSLQPMVKGNNLLIFFEELITRISELHNSIREIESEQVRFNTLLASHKHQSGTTITDEPIGKEDLEKFSKNILNLSATHAQVVEIGLGFMADKYFPAGKEFSILSSFNRVN